MKAKLSAFVIIGLIFLNVNSAYSIPRPCTQEELLKTSHYAIEGYVVSVECQEAYDSEECKPQSESREFKPELVSNCIATIEVSKSLKGNYNVGDKLKIPF